MQHLSAKLKAFSIHLFLSVLIISLFLLLVTQVWYPDLLFEIEDVWEGLQILIPVDAILGPLLTLVLFVPGKKGQKMDLTVIAVLQIVALIYGGYTIYKQRPVALVFVADRFEVVVASEAFVADIPLSRFENKEKSFPFLSYVLMAQSNQERSDSITSGINFKNIGDRHFPLKDNLDDLIEHSIKLDSLKIKTPEDEEVLNQFIERNKNKKNLILLPLQGTTYKTITLVLDTKSFKVVEYLPLSIWDW